MVHVTEISIGFSALSGVIGVALLTFAVRAYRRSRNPHMAFLIGAFSLFSVKAFLVAYSIATGLIEHELLELVDAVGDLGTILLLFMPILWPPKDDSLDPGNA